VVEASRIRKPVGDQCYSSSSERCLFGADAGSSGSRHGFLPSCRTYFSMSLAKHCIWSNWIRAMICRLPYAIAHYNTEVGDLLGESPDFLVANAVLSLDANARIMAKAERMRDAFWYSNTRQHTAIVPHGA